MISKLLHQSLNDDHLLNIKDNLPVKINVSVSKEGTIFYDETKDKEIIEKIVEAFCEITIIEETDIMVTDNDNSICFIFDDEKESRVNFNRHNLELYIDGKYYIYVLDNYKNLFYIINNLIKE